MSTSIWQRLRSACACRTCGHGRGPGMVFLGAGLAVVAAGAWSGRPALAAVATVFIVLGIVSLARRGGR